MTILLAALALRLVPEAMTDQGPGTSARQQDQQVEAIARNWLELVDAGDAKGSYARTTDQFRSVNTLETWAEVSARVRGPLGATLSRTLTAVDLTPTPQQYTIVKFTSRFANRETPLIETVSLVEEDGAWRIAGVYVG